MKKLGLILLVAIMALGALGAAYAAWSQTLNIDANVYTGTLSATIAQTPGQLITATPSYVNCVLGSSGSTSTDLIVTIRNAAPGAVISVPYTITNTGSIPVGNANVANPNNGYLSVGGSVGDTGSIAVSGSFSGILTVTVSDAVAMGTGPYMIDVLVTITQ
jgi:hypothetical protein